MNGPHDLGGMMGFGPVVPEAERPVFHDAWERRAFALTLAMGFTGSWNIDMARHARERIPPADYLASSYYEIWIKGLECLMREAQLVSAEELETGHAAAGPAAVKRVATAETVPGILAKGGPADRAARVVRKFQPGERVRARNMHPEGHTRLPRYLRGHVGEIVMVHGCHVFPDSSAHGKGDDPQWLYAVKFTAAEVWGNGRRDSIVADLWEPYLEAV